MSIEFVQGGTPNPAPTPPDPPNPVEDWNLLPGHFVSTDITGMAPIITFPRADASVNAYCKNAYNDGTNSMKWEIPIVVQGGSWPFRYQVTNGPAGMQMGEVLSQGVDTQTVGETYATLWWDDPQPGSYSITVLVTDQDLNPATVTWTLVVGSSNWVFIDRIFGSPSGAGTYSDPLQTWQDLWKGSNSDTTYANKIACFYEGTYLVNENGVDAAAKIEVDSKPIAWVPWNNGTTWADVTFDMSTAGLSVRANDIYLGRLRFDGYRDTAKNFRTIALASLTNNDRFTAYRLTFSNMTLTAIWTLGRQYYVNDWTHDNVDADLRTTYQVLVDHIAGAIDGTLAGDVAAGLIAPSGTNGIVGIVGDDNPACIFVSGGGRVQSRQYISCIRCVQEDTVGFMLFETYDCDYVVAEHNIGDDVTTICGNGAKFIYVKVDNRYVTIRRNRAINRATTYTTPGIFFSAGNDLNKRDHIEICWNLTETTAGDRPTNIANGWGGSGGLATNTFHYRNTHIEHFGRAVQYSGDPAEGGDPVITLVNALSTDGTAGLIRGTGYDDSLDPIANQTFSTSDFDANGDLQGAARTSDLGIRGHEVA